MENNSHVDFGDTLIGENMLPGRVISKTIIKMEQTASLLSMQCVTVGV